MEKSVVFSTFALLFVLPVVAVYSKGGNLMESFAVEGEKEGRETGAADIYQSAKLPCASSEKQLVHATSCIAEY